MNLNIEYLSFHLFARSRKHRYRKRHSDFAEKYSLGEPIYVNYFKSEYDAYVDVLERNTKRFALSFNSGLNSGFECTSYRCICFELLFLVLLEFVHRVFY